MGVPLKDIIPSEKITMEELSHKVIAVDAFNAIYQFLANIRQPDGSPLLDSHGRVTSHLKGLLNRNSAFMSMHILPVYVFDGMPDELKADTLRERNTIREGAKEEWEKAVEEGDLEKARTKARESTRITTEEVRSAKNLLRLMGIPVIDAPAEGEAQASYIAARGDAWAAASQDYDVLLFGAPRLIRNLALSGRRKLPRSNMYVDVSIEYIERDKVLSTLGLTRDELIDMALLIGTDYNEGYKGIGPKTALKLIKEHKTFEKAAESKGLRVPENLSKLREMFRSPPVLTDYRLEFKPVDVEGVVSFLVHEHDFTEEGVRNVLEKMSLSSGVRKKDADGRKKKTGIGEHAEGQSRLDTFF